MSARSPDLDVKEGSAHFLDVMGRRPRMFLPISESCVDVLASLELGITNPAGRVETRDLHGITSAWVGADWTRADAAASPAAAGRHRGRRSGVRGARRP